MPQLKRSREKLIARETVFFYTEARLLLTLASAGVLQLGIKSNELLYKS